MLATYLRVMDESARLQPLMRLVDYMVAEACVGLGIQMAADFLAYFDNPLKTRVSGSGQGDFLSYT